MQLLPSLSTQLINLTFEVKVLKKNGLATSVKLRLILHTTIYKTLAWLFYICFGHLIAGWAVILPALWSIQFFDKA